MAKQLAGAKTPLASAFNPGFQLRQGVVFEGCAVHAAKLIRIR